MTIKTKLSHRLLSIFLCIALLMSYLPMSMLAMTALAEGTSNGITTVADPETLTQFTVTARLMPERSLSENRSATRILPLTDRRFLLTGQIISL